MDWYSEALGERYIKLAQIKDRQLQSGVSKGEAYFLSLKERRTKKEIENLKDSRARLAKCFGAKNANA